MNKITTIVLLGLGLFFLITAPALAEDIDDPLLPFKMPGQVEGTGTYFEITDSEYLNASLQSSEEITILLESVPKTINLHIETSSVSVSTILTFSNLEPNTTYYKFEDSYKNKVIFVTDSSGSYTFTQDLTQFHHIWIQPEDNGTIFLPEDCSTYGIWDESTSTCTLTQDLAQTVEITENNIVLDCNGLRIHRKWGWWRKGLYLNNKSGVTIKNCTVSNFRHHGIRLYRSNNNKLDNNVVLNNVSDGISLLDSNGNILSNNIMDSNRLAGINLSDSKSNILDRNTASSNSRGIYLFRSSNNTFTENIISNNRYNFYLYGSETIHFINYVDTSNLVDGKPIYYLLDVRDRVFDSSTNAGLFYCINCENIVVKDLRLTKNWDGILFWNTHNSKIENVVVSNNCYGIRLNHSSNNILISNIASGSERWGIALVGSPNNTITSNTVTNNFANGIALDSSSNNNLINNIVNYNGHRGIHLYDSSYNVLNSNTVSNNGYDAIFLAYSSNNILTFNTVNYNSQGICLTHSSNNTLNSNTVHNNIRNGFFLRSFSSNNIFNSNIVSNNMRGILLYWCTYCRNNKIYHNNFINNEIQAYTDGGRISNRFDNGYPDGGNHWSDYTGVDLYSGPNQDQPGTDGIGDVSYTFPGDQDRYPFMKKDGWKRIRSDKAVGLAKEVIGKNYHFERGNSLTKGYYQDSTSKKFIFLNSEDIEYLDCSGLSFWSFNRAYYDGRELTKTEFEDRPLYYEGANMQYRGNIDKELQLTKEGLQPGDLLFFDTWNRNTETYGQDNIVDHVAMYIGLYEGEQYAVEHAHKRKDNTNNAGKISVTTVDGLIDYYKGKFGEGAFVDFGRVIDKKVAVKFTGHSPIDLIITDPDGETIYENIGEREAISELGDVGNSLTMGYMVYDIDGDGEPDDIVASPERKIGDYLITVVAEPDALPTDTYSLRMEALINGEIITAVLAENVPIGEIPRAPYTVRSTEAEIILIISAFVDFDPDTLNLESKGKWATAYIELPENYDANLIDLNTILLNDQVPAINDPKYEFVTDPNSYLVDFDNNGILERMVKFDQSAAQNILEVGDEVEIIITGELTDGSPFQGSDTIRVISKGKKVAILTVALLACMGVMGLLTYKRKQKPLNGIIKIIKRITNFRGK